MLSNEEAREISEQFKKRADEIRKDRGDDDFYVIRLSQLAKSWEPTNDRTDLPRKR